MLIDALDRVAGEGQPGLPIEEPAPVVPPAAAAEAVPETAEEFAADAGSPSRGASVHEFPTSSPVDTDVAPNEADVTAVPSGTRP